MIQHHRPRALRSALSRVAIAGTASIATIVAVAPVAMAAPGDEIAPAESSSETTLDETIPDAEAPAAEPVEDPAPPAEEPVTELVEETVPTAESPAEAKSDVAPLELIEEEADEEVTPNYGFQKFRVGVQLADGAYAPDASTVGSTIEITISGEPDFGGIFSLEAAPSETFTCDTDESTVEGTASYCLSEDFAPAAVAGAVSGDVARSVSQSEEEIPPDQTFVLLPGQTATFKQVTAGEGLIKSPATSVIEPCEADPDFLFIPFCMSGDFDELDEVDVLSTSVLFANFGPPPVAKNDKITATAGDPTTIKVTENDDTGNGAPIESVDITSGPKHGTAKVSGTRVIYTADDDFDGTDTFDYRLTTANGSDTARVTINVEPDELLPDTGTVQSSNTTAVLPDTGAPDNSVLGYAALLLAGGAWLTARGRRRTDQDALVG